MDFQANLRRSSMAVLVQSTGIETERRIRAMKGREKPRRELEQMRQ